MPNCGIHWRLHSSTQRCAVAPRAATHMASVATKSTQMLRRAIQRAAAALREATTHETMPPTIRMRMRMSSIMSSPQEKRNCENRDGSHRESGCIPAHASGLRSAQSSVAEHGDVAQAANKSVCRVAFDRSSDPQKRANEQSLVNPVEAPACEPELLQDAFFGDACTLRSVEEKCEGEADGEDCAGGERGDGFGDGMRMDYLKRRQDAVEEIGKSGHTAEIRRSVHISAHDGEEAEHDQCKANRGAAVRFYMQLLWSVEGEQDETEGIERGEHSSGHAGNPEPGAAVRSCPRLPQNEVLAEEAGSDERQAGEGASTDDEGPEGKRQLGAQAAHAEHILLMHGMNDYSCGEEEQRLEKGMRHEMEQGRRPCAQPESEKHIADLADGGIGQYTFNVALRERAEGGEQHGCCSDDGNGKLHLRSQSEEHMRAGDEIDACRHHGCSVDEGAGWRSAGHGIRQPCLERQLRGFSAGSAQQQCGCGNGDTAAYCPLCRGAVHQLLNVQRAEYCKQQEEADGEGGIAESCHDECLGSGANIGWVLIPEANEQKTAEANAFPSQVQQQKIVRQDEHEHRRYEEVHVGEEARVAFIVLHVLGRVEMDQKTNEGDDEQHQQ